LSKIRALPHSAPSRLRCSNTAQAPRNLRSFSKWIFYRGDRIWASGAREEPGASVFEKDRTVLKKRRPGVLIIVENLTVPLDRRVWQEACALRDAGYTVSVICPKGGVHKAPYELLEGIHIFRHPLPVEARGPLGYLAEYSIALFFEFVLSVKAHFKVGFDAVQATTTTSIPSSTRPSSDAGTAGIACFTVWSA
jgi:Glycosyl transferase 4-like